MNFRFKRLALVASLSFTLLTPTLSVGTVWADNASLTRGDFIKLISEQLKLTPSNPSTALPKDVPTDSVYANAARVMIERHILNGYEDGTFRLNQEITKEQVAYVLGRFLGIEDSASESKLKSSFGVDLKNSTNLSGDTALSFIHSSLSNDKKAVAWLNDSSGKQLEIHSFHTDMNMNIGIVFKPGEEQARLGTITTKMKSQLDFNKKSGIHQISSTELPGANGAAKMDIEQFIVKEGTFTKMADPATGDIKWLNMSKQIPFTFDQLIELQKNSTQLNKTLISPYFFYRDLGSEDVNGVKLHKIELNGNLTNTAELLKTLGGLIGDQSMVQQLADSSALSNMDLALSTTLWFDEQTKLITRMDASYRITYGNDSAIPIDHMDMSMTAAYKDYDQVKDILLPDEAKKAEELPALQLPTQTPSSAPTPAPTSGQ